MIEQLIAILDVLGLATALMGFFMLGRKKMFGYPLLAWSGMCWLAIAVEYHLYGMGLAALLVVAACIYKLFLEEKVKL